MARLGRLAGGIAHHFNNLHAIILSYATFVTDELSREIEAGAVRWEQTHRDVDQIRRAAELATKLTRQLMTFAEQDIVQPELISLNDVVAGPSGPCRAGSARTSTWSCILIREPAARSWPTPVISNRSWSISPTTPSTRCPMAARLTIETIKVGRPQE